MTDFEDYGLDIHSSMMIEEYRKMLPTLEKIKEIALERIHTFIGESGMIVSGIEGRVKTEKSLAGKLLLKGFKYKSLQDITDLVGTRVVTFFVEDVDKIASLVTSNFDVDWNNSVDKRKILTPQTFGYMSLHYICRIPESLFYDEAMPQVNRFRFEIQMRTALQHVWATMNHDTGYKSGFEIPVEYRRALTRLAGLLELADEEFFRLHNEIAEYKRKVEAVVKDGNFNQLDLNGDSFKSYVSIDPFSRLNNRIASINHAEIQPTSIAAYFKVLVEFNFNTLGDIEKLKADCSEDAYQLAVIQLSGTDLDIIASSIGLHNLITIYIAKKGYGEKGIKHFLDILYGRNTYNEESARRLMNQVRRIPSMQAFR